MDVAVEKNPFPELAIMKPVPSMDSCSATRHIIRMPNNVPKGPLDQPPCLEKLLLRKTRLVQQPDCRKRPGNEG